MKVSRIALVAACGSLLVAARRFTPVRAAGDSMAPTVLPGDLLAVRRLRASEPWIGQVVIADVGDREVVKRVVAPPGEVDGFWLEGDHAERSTDSRTGGGVARDDIVSVVGFCYWPPRRIRVFAAGREFPSAKRRPGGSRGSLR